MAGEPRTIREAAERIVAIRRTIGRLTPGMLDDLEAALRAAPEPRREDVLEQAEMDAAEESLRFVPPFQGGFREGARWALARWRRSVSPTPARPSLWDDPNRAERMRNGLPHGDWHIVTRQCKACGYPYPCPFSALPVRDEERNLTVEFYEPPEAERLWSVHAGQAAWDWSERG